METHRCLVFGKREIYTCALFYAGLCSGMEQLLRLISFQERQSCYWTDTPTVCFPTPALLVE